jgi:glycerol-3-phosphate dehydrogenase
MKNRKSCYDVCIVGAGTIGAAIARELSRYKLDVLLLEKGEDVAVGAGKANSGIVHGGYTAVHGSLKGELSIRGNRQFDVLADELGFPFRRNGSLVLAFSSEQERSLEKLRKNGEKNGVKGLKLIDRREIEKVEPETGPAARSALRCIETGIVSPYEYCIALAENAVGNGVELRLRSKLREVKKRGGGFCLEIVEGKGRDVYSLHCSFLVNAAGVYADRIAALAGDESLFIQPRKGQYLIFQRGTGKMARHVVFQAPTERGKGVLVSSTVWGNLIIGPNSEEIPDREDTSTNEQIIRSIVSTARRSIPGFDLSKVIRSFSGIRATEEGKDFVVRESASVPGLIHAAGIDSPGLTSSPAIAERLLSLLCKSGLDAEKKDDFEPRREAITTPHDLRPFGEVKEAIELPEGDPRRIVCRCEQVSEAVVLDALRRGIRVDGLDAVKRRTRAGMGPCQGQFCGPRVKKLVAKELGIDPEDVGPRGPGSGPLPERVDRETLRRLDV